MYLKILVYIKPTKRLEKITYVNLFDVELCLLLREIRPPSLASMQEATLEVESNICAAKTLRGKSERRKFKEDFQPSSSNPKSQKTSLEEMDRKMEEMSAELAKLRLENKNWNRPLPEGGNINFNQFKRPYNPQIL